MPPIARRHSFRLGAAAWLAIGMAVGCERGPAVPPPVTVLAAASTAEGVAELAAIFETKTGVAVRVSAGPSNGLARQVVSGVPADIFLSASEDWAAAVAEAGHSAAVRPLLVNRLVLIVPVGNPAGVTGLDGLTAPAVRRIALAGAAVPAGRYADAALATLGLSDRLADKIVRGHDVRAALAYVERGEAEAGVVYATDAVASRRVAVVHRFDPATHPPIICVAVLLRDGPAGAAGRRFWDFLATPEAAKAFRLRGFSTVGAAP